jgi:cell division protein ZapA
MADKPSAVHVEIFGQTYAVQAGSEPGYVEQLAGFVDGQMREVSRAAGAVDTVRIAVLAALNIADELFRARGQADAVLQRATQRVEGIARELHAALEE